MGFILEALGGNKVLSDEDKGQFIFDFIQNQLNILKKEWRRQVKHHPNVILGLAGSRYFEELLFQFIRFTNLFFPDLKTLDEKINLWKLYKKLKLETEFKFDIDEQLGEVEKHLFNDPYANWRYDFEQSRFKTYDEMYATRDENKYPDQENPRIIKDWTDEKAALFEKKVINNPDFGKVDYENQRSWKIEAYEPETEEEIAREKY